MHRFQSRSFGFCKKQNSSIALATKKSKNIWRIRGKEDALRPNQIVCIGIMDKVLYENHQIVVNRNPLPPVFAAN